MAAPNSAWRARVAASMKGQRRTNDGALSDQLIESEDLGGWLLYVLIVRALRLCDGHALEGGE